jgi:hypothetical protein
MKMSFVTIVILEHILKRNCQSSTLFVSNNVINENASLFCQVMVSQVVVRVPLLVYQALYTDTCH